jgi:hypothetical protein
MDRQSAVRRRLARTLLLVACLASTAAATQGVAAAETRTLVFIVNTPNTPIGREKIEAGSYFADNVRMNRVLIDGVDRFAYKLNARNAFSISTGRTDVALGQVGGPLVLFRVSQASNAIAIPEGRPGTAVTIRCRANFNPTIRWSWICRAA